MSPPSGGLRTQAQQQRRTQQQPQQQQAPADDELLESAPPAFPQPVSSLPHSPAHRYQYPAPSAFAAAAGVGFTTGPGATLPVVSSQPAYNNPSSQQLLLQQQQQQQQQPWGAADAAVLSRSFGSGPLPAGMQQGAQPAAAGAAPFGYTVDGLPLPYDVAMAPYAAAYQATYVNGMYGNEASQPLLTDPGGFNGDMVFANRQVRHAFVRKVLGLLTLQLLLTAAVAMPFVIKKPVRRFLHANPWVSFIALVLCVTLLLVLACSETARRRHPTNLLLLGAFTLAEGCLVGTSSATYATNAPIVGVLITAAVSLALIVYALQTSVDFTASGGMLYSAVVILAVVTLAEHYLGFKTLHLLVGGCGSLLFCAYLVFDVQLQASGESSYAVNADEHVFGTINVYTDVINIFLYFIQLVSHAGDVHDELH